MGRDAGFILKMWPECKGRAYHRDPTSLLEDCDTPSPDATFEARLDACAFA